MQAKLTQSVRALANGAVHDKDGSPVLKSVLIKDGQAIVADGFMLVIKALPSPEMALDGPPPDDGIRQVNIPADALKACDAGDVTLTCMEVMRPKAAGQFDTGVPSMKLIARLDGVDFDVEADAVEGNYPDYSKLFYPHPKLAEIALSTSILKKLLKCLPDGAPLMLRIGERDKPVEFQCPDPDGDIPITGMVMPIAVQFEQVKWRCSESIGEAIATGVMDTLKEAAQDGETAKPSDADTVTIEAAGQKVTLTQEQFEKAAKAKRRK